MGNGLGGNSKCDQNYFRIFKIILKTSWEKKKNLDGKLTEEFQIIHTSVRKNLISTLS